jgi:hypothetical protein
MQPHPARLRSGVVVRAEAAVRDARTTRRDIPGRNFRALTVALRAARYRPTRNGADPQRWNCAARLATKPAGFCTFAGRSTNKDGVEA